jgi:hypothetical protein
MPLNATIRFELAKLAPYGFLATRAWLTEQGLERHSIDNLVKSRQLVPLQPGVYKRPETTLKWQGVVCSLQRMGSDLAVGGLTALELHGFSHYLVLSGRRTVHLYGLDALPSWANKLGLSEYFLRHGQARLFGPEKTDQDRDRKHRAAFTVDLPWGDQSWPLRVSTPERALFELLEDVPASVSFEHADQLMQGLSSLSPRRLDGLLRRMRSVKVKRLFFWLAERQGHAWLRKLDPGQFDLGRGKRMLAKGGKLDRKYQITVPEDMHG